MKKLLSFIFLFFLVFSLGACENLKGIFDNESLETKVETETEEHHTSEDVKTEEHKTTEEVTEESTLEGTGSQTGSTDSGNGDNPDDLVDGNYYISFENTNDTYKLTVNQKDHDYYLVDRIKLVKGDIINVLYKNNGVISNIKFKALNHPEHPNNYDNSKGVIDDVLEAIICFNIKTNELWVSGLKQSTEEAIIIWAPRNMVDTYYLMLDEYLANHPDGPQNVKIVEKEVDYTPTMLEMEPESCADIILVPGDAVGRLQLKDLILPINSNSLKDQITNQNREANLITYQDPKSKEFYGAPATLQSLVLYYDKRVFTTDKLGKLSSFEGLLEVAESEKRLATGWMGNDGYNFTAFLLAQPESSDAVEAFGKMGTLQLFDNGDPTKNMAHGDDQVAIFRYAQSFIRNRYGRNGHVVDYNYPTDVFKGETLTFIGGNWNRGTAEEVYGRENVGVTTLPSFTLTEADAYGKAKAGMKFKAGSFVDTCCFVKNKASKSPDKLDDIITFLTSDEMQSLCMHKGGMTPASKNITSSQEIFKAQMNQVGRPQPFGFYGPANFNYYSCGTQNRYVEIAENKKNWYDDIEVIKLALEDISAIWQYGKR